MINVLDAYTTYRGLQHPRVYERNPLLGRYPSAGEIAAFKLFWGAMMIDLAGDNDEDLIFPNALLTFAVINNIEVMESVGLISY